MRVLTIAVPTFNRADKLKVALDAIGSLIVPDGLRLYVAISNSHSTDHTTEFLNNVSFDNAALFINNKNNTSENNCVALSKVVPVQSDFVWLHGDDDIIFDKFALIKLNQLNRFDQTSRPSITSIPQARRSKGTGGHNKAGLGELSCIYGGHEILGWMSSLLLSREVFSNLMHYHEVANYGCPDSKEIHNRKLGNLGHLTILLEHSWFVETNIVDIPIIDEQIDESNKKEYERQRRRFEFEYNFLFSDRFFFDAMKLVNLSSIHTNAQSEIFFRYTTKSLVDVLLNITFDEFGSTEVTQRLSLSEKISVIEEVNRAMGSHSKLDGLNRIIRLLRNAVILGNNNTDRLRNSWTPFSFPPSVVI